MVAPFRPRFRAQQRRRFDFSKRDVASSSAGVMKKEEDGKVSLLMETARLLLAFAVLVALATGFKRAAGASSLQQAPSAKRVLLVAPGLPGMRDVGSLDISTLAAQYGAGFSAAGHSVSVVMPFAEHANYEAVRREYAEKGNISVHLMPRIPSIAYGTSGMSQSWGVFRFIESHEQRFDVIWFFDLGGLGLYTAQAKQWAPVLAQSLIVVSYFGSTRLQRISAGLPLGRRHILQTNLEDAARSLADVAIYPEQSYADWMKRYSSFTQRASSNAIVTDSVLDVLQYPAVPRPPLKVAQPQQLCAQVTVAIATCNRLEEFLSCLAALAKQTCSSFSLMVMNTGDPFEGEVLGEVEQAMAVAASGNWKLVNMEPETYITEARSAMIAQASTKYVLLFDDDDIPLPHLVQDLVLAASSTDADATTGFCYNNQNGRRRVADVSDMPVSMASGVLGASNFYSHMAGKAAMLVNRETARRLGGMVQDGKRSPFVDWAFYQRLSYAQSTITVVPRPLYVYLKNNSNSIFYSRTPEQSNLGRVKIVNDLCSRFNLTQTLCDILLVAKT